jgi:hypothetical protein
LLNPTALAQMRRDRVAADGSEASLSGLFYTALLAV